MSGVTVEGDVDRKVDGRAMREILGHFVTGVAVVTSPGRKGPVGVTVNSFTSVSLAPPIVLFCIHERSTVWTVLMRSQVFAVNILAEDQAEVCRNFARQRTALFNDVESRPGITGAPILLDALAYLDCEILSQHRAGDHWIILGKVLDTGVLRDGRPLAFFRSGHPRLDLRS